LIYSTKTFTGPSVAKTSVPLTKNKKIRKTPINPPEKTDTVWITAIVEKRTHPNSTKSSKHNA
jgi:hypothetical protein